MKKEKFKVLLYLKKSSLDKSGKAPIMGRITLGQSMAQFSCKLSCSTSLWNSRESRLNGKSREAVTTNTKLDKLLLAVNGAYDVLIECKQSFDALAVKDLFQGSVDTQMTLLKLFDRHIEEIKARIGIDVSYRTLPNYLYTRKRLVLFIKKKSNTSDLAFSQLNELFIREFQDFLVLDQRLGVETVRHYLAILKKICRIAFKEGHSDRHYFANYPLLKQKENPPRTLSREYFEKIRDLEIEEHRSSHITTRDMFLFACYTGTAYVDVVAITNENLSKDDAGNLWLKYQRGKNGKLCRVKLLPEAIDLIEKYRNKSRETLFPKMEYNTLKWNLQSIRQILGIPVLTYHMGRHSFSSLITLEGGVPIETVSKMLGHADIKTTQIYARVTPKKLFEDMDKYIEVTKDLKLVL
ncbi:site-specific recombinase XerD [Dysgonomonas alginatilytica]|uniref:Site-specific recombinase XerD n=1 Tax=Dysgonomonas alginatilytica TaxID=1605892 RepID=A0A2V3PHF9_9BACT|nr:site-specific integrase [Dysgonomonas alginatilytica]PXV57165.1 site-specific recombinase XerD [Dysgonomonas alginatilytica]